MKWWRIDDWHAQSDDPEGYSIVLSRAHDGNGSVYLCYGPPRPGWRQALKEQYGPGERVPRERALLGTARDPEQARALCAQHHQENANAA